MTRREQRRAAIAARKAETKARLALPVTPPTEPVALPWRRRASDSRVKLQRRAEDAAWSVVMSGDARDLAGSLAAAASMVRMLGPALRGRR